MQGSLVSGFIIIIIIIIIPEFQRNLQPLPCDSGSLSGLLSYRTMLIASRMEERHQDEETMDNLDFEEISDEELDPEESKTGEPIPQIVSPPLSFFTEISNLFMLRFCGRVVRVPGYRSGGAMFDSRRYQIF
jgi:hypothetical protein